MMLFRANLISCNATFYLIFFLPLNFVLRVFTFDLVIEMLVISECSDLWKYVLQ